MAIPSNQLPIGEGLHPDGTPGASFFIDKDVLYMVEEDGPEWKYDDAGHIYEAVNDPDAIFAGLKRHGQDAAFGYCVTPTRAPNGESDWVQRYGYVFITFVRPCIGGLLVFDWDWRVQDQNNPWYPANWQSDFASPDGTGNPIWQRKT